MQCMRAGHIFADSFKLPSPFSVHGSAHLQERFQSGVMPIAEQTGAPGKLLRQLTKAAVYNMT